MIFIFTPFSVLSFAKVWKSSLIFENQSMLISPVFSFLSSLNRGYSDHAKSI